MAEIIIAAAASAAGSGLATAMGLAVGSIAYGVVSGLTSAAVGAMLSSALGLNKPPGKNKLDTGTSQMVRSAVANRGVVYGRAITSGPIVFAASSGKVNKYLHLVVPLAHGESRAIGAIWFGDTRVGDLDGSGNVTTGKYAGFMRIKKHLGAADQVADSDLTSAVAKWTANHRLRGITYLYVRLTWDPAGNVYPYGLENIKAEVYGRTLYDPRTAATGWSDNWALALHDYVTQAYGLAAAAAEVDSTTIQAAAALADEMVLLPTALSSEFTATASADTLTLSDATTAADLLDGDGVRFASTGTPPAPLAAATTYYVIQTATAKKIQLATSLANARAGTALDLTDAGSGTHTLTRYSQPRYTVNGVVDLGATPRNGIESLLSAAAGTLVWSQGKYFLHGAAYAAPSVSLTEDDLRGPLTLRAKPERRALFNGVRGTYRSPRNYWQPADFPAITNATYETQDGGEQVLKDIELPYTIDSYTAQRIAKTILERGRQGITCTLPCKLTAFTLRAWDTVQLTIAHLGWSAKVFRVTEWRLNPDGGIDLTLQEEAFASYSWAAADATVVDGAADTDLPSLVTVTPPTALSVASGDTYQLVQADGVTLCRLYATWTAADEETITHYEIQWKLSADSVWQSQVQGSGATSAYIGPVQSGEDYDVRVRSINTIGGVSAWEGPDTLTASSDATTLSYDSVTGGPPADADNTSDAIEAAVTVTSGGITFDAGGHIKGGQTGYHTGNGWFLGHSGDAYKFSLGDPGGSYVTWDGYELTVRGAVDNLYESGSNLCFAGTVELRTVASGTPGKVREVIMDRSGTVNVKFNLISGSGGYTANGRIYVNGVARGTTRSTSATSYSTYTEDIDVERGDLLQLYLWRSSGTSYAANQIFEFYATVPSSPIDKLP